MKITKNTLMRISNNDEYNIFLNNEVKTFGNTVILELVFSPVELVINFSKLVFKNLKNKFRYVLVRILKQKYSEDKKIQIFKELINLNFPEIEIDNSKIDFKNLKYSSAKKNFVEMQIKCLQITKNFLFINFEDEITIEVDKKEKKIISKQKYTQSKKWKKEFDGVQAEEYQLENLPLIQEEISNMKNQKVTVKGVIFSTEEKEVKKGYVYKIYITNYIESAIVVFFSQEKFKVNGSDEDETEEIDFLVGKAISATGIYEINSYDNLPEISNAKIEFIENDFTDPFDLSKTLKEEPKTRCEFSVHTKFSQLDGLTDVDTYFKNAKALGLDAIAITDHENIEVFPDTETASKKYGIKAIYGVCLNVLNDEKYKIFYQGKDSLKNHFIAFDIETTGFSANFDDVIQISAVKLSENLKIVDKFNVFVKTNRLSQKISDLTLITNEILNEKGIEQNVALKQFYDFIDDGILIAHNANFDVEFIEWKFQTLLGIEKRYSYIDTLSFSRNILKNEMSRFSLDKVCSKLKIKSENRIHHRADSDAIDCAMIFVELMKLVNEQKLTIEELGDYDDNITFNVTLKARGKDTNQKLLDYLNNSFIDYKMEEDLESKTLNRTYEMIISKKTLLKISTEETLSKVKIVDIVLKKNLIQIKELNSLIQTDEYLMNNSSMHINCYIKNQAGKKELYKLISLAHTERLNSHGTNVLLSDLRKCDRNNLLFSNAGVNGLFKNYYEKGLNVGTFDIDFFDFIEIQPINAYLSVSNAYIKNIRNEIKKTVITMCKEAYKRMIPIIADSDAYYLLDGQKPLRKIYTETIFQGESHRLKNAIEIGDNRLMSTSEFVKTLKNDYNFKDETIEKFVFENPKFISDKISEISITPSKLFTPNDEFFKNTSMKIVGHQVNSAKEEMDNILNKALECYKIDGKLPEYIQARIDKELNSIYGYGFHVIYYISYLLVKKSNADGYVVGSRGSVGSSFVANLMGITEVNALKPHYRCPKCHYQIYKGEKSLFINLDERKLRKNVESVDDGLDLPICKCPRCNTTLKSDGHDIPFETFLGFKGDKVPDIDLNFSGEYQAKAMNFLKEVFGENYAFRAGTVGTVAEKTAKMYVEKYFEENNLKSSPANIMRQANLMTGVKRTTGQHAGGIIVVPNDMEIYDFTPIQYPANKRNDENPWFTTHFDFHKIHDNILKMDILGHNDPTMLKALMDIVKEHPENYPFDNVKDIPIADEKTFALLKEDAEGFIDSLGISEFGTNFVTGMLHKININTFADLVKVSGLSHGTDVWTNNNEELMSGNTEFGKIDFKDTIGCRDDIMVQMIAHNIDNKTSFDIMEFVRKGKVQGNPDKWAEYKQIMKEHNVPDWYIWSCEKIKYMFPKAHAVAYVMSALRIAWFKAHRPLDFYQAIFSVRAEQFDAEVISSNNIELIKSKIDEIRKSDMTKNDKDTIHFMEMAIEMIQKGFFFEAPLPNKSDAFKFIKLDANTLLMPFSAIKGIGESKALQLFNNRIAPYLNEEDFKERGGANKKVIEALYSMNHLIF